MCLSNEIWTRNARLYWFCLRSSSHYSVLLFWPILIFCLLCLTSVIRLLLKSSCPFTASSQFYYFSYSAQFLTQILAPHLFAWTTQRWVIALWLLFCFQFSSSKNSQFWSNPWDREPAWSLVVWGPAALTSLGRFLGMQNLRPHCRPTESESVYLHFKKIPMVILYVH